MAYGRSPAVAGLPSPFSDTGGGGFDLQNFLGGPSVGQDLGSVLYGIFGRAGSPYESAQKQYEQLYPQAQQYQQPFYQAGMGAIPQFQDWLKGMQDRSEERRVGKECRSR